MMQRLREIQVEYGAQWGADDGMPATFDNDPVALQAARAGVALCDRSHWGRIQLTDQHRQTFLHNQSANNIQVLKPGQGCDTVFITSTARTLDLATVYVMDEAVLVVVSPNRRDFLLQWLDRYIFFGDKVGLQDVTDQTAMFSLIGPGSDDLLSGLRISLPEDMVYGRHWQTELAGHPVTIAVGEGLAIAGYTLITDGSHAAAVWQALVQAGAVPMGDRAWEHLRIHQGRPAPDHELTEDFNAVEACLWQAISINKGCYIGQETIARLDTYQGVKQQIWGIRFDMATPPIDPPLAVGTPIAIGEDKVGVLTSLTTGPDGVFGLGYIRTKVAQPNLAVQIGPYAGTLVDVPFLQRDRVTSTA